MTTGRQVVFAGAADVAARIGAIVLFAALARGTGPVGFGAYAQGNTIVAFVAPFAALGLTAAMVRYFAGAAWDTATRAQFRGVLQFVLALSIAVALALWLLAGTMNDLFLGVPFGAELFRWSAPLVVVTAIELVLLDFLRARQWLAQMTFTQLGSNLGVVALGTAVLVLGGTVIDVVRMSVLVKAAVIVVTVASIWRLRSAAPAASATTHRHSIGRMVSFGLPVAVSGLGLWSMNYADRLVIGHYLTATELGVYTATYGLALLIAGAYRPLNLPLYPRLVASISAGDQDRTGSEIRTFQRFGTLVLAPASVFLIVGASRVLSILGGEQFQPDMLLVALLVLAVAINQWNGIAQYVVLARDQVAFSQNVWLISGALNVVANLVVVPIVGLIGAAAVTCLTFLGLEAAFFIAASRYQPLAALYRWAVLARALLSSAVAAAAALAIWSLLPRDAVALVLGTAAFLGVYVLGMLALREIRREDLRLVQGVFSSRA